MSDKGVFPRQFALTEELTAAHDAHVLTYDHATKMGRMRTAGELITPPPAGHTVHLYVHQDNDSSTPGWDVTHFASLQKAVDQARIEFQASRVVIHLMHGYVWNTRVTILGWDASKIEIISDEETKAVSSFAQATPQFSINSINQGPTVGITQIGVLEGGTLYGMPRCAVTGFTRDPGGWVRVQASSSSIEGGYTGIVALRDDIYIIEGSIGEDPSGHGLDPSHPQYISPTQFTYDGVYLHGERRWLSRVNPNDFSYTGQDPIWLGSCNVAFGFRRIINRTLMKTASIMEIVLDDEYDLVGVGDYSGVHSALFPRGIQNHGNDISVYQQTVYYDPRPVDPGIPSTPRADPLPIHAPGWSYGGGGTIHNTSITLFRVDHGQPLFAGGFYEVLNSGSYTKRGHVIRSVQIVPGGEDIIESRTPFVSGQPTGQISLMNAVEAIFTSAHGYDVDDFIGVFGSQYEDVYRIKRVIDSTHIVLDGEYRGPIPSGTTVTTKKGVQVATNAIFIENTYGAPILNALLVGSSLGTGINLYNASVLIKEKNCGCVNFYRGLLANSDSRVNLENASFGYNHNDGISVRNSFITLNNINFNYCGVYSFYAVNCRSLLSIIHANYCGYSTKVRGRSKRAIDILGGSGRLGDLYIHYAANSALQVSSSANIEIAGHLDILNYCNSETDEDFSHGVSCYNSYLSHEIRITLPNRVVRRVWPEGFDVESLPADQRFNRHPNDYYIHPNSRGSLIAELRRHYNVAGTNADPGRASGGGCNHAFNTLLQTGIVFSSGSPMPV